MLYFFIHAGGVHIINVTTLTSMIFCLTWGISVTPRCKELCSDCRKMRCLITQSIAFSVQCKATMSYIIPFLLPAFSWFSVLPQVCTWGMLSPHWFSSLTYIFLFSFAQLLAPIIFSLLPPLQKLRAWFNAYSSWRYRTLHSLDSSFFPYFILLYEFGLPRRLEEFWNTVRLIHIMILH